MSAAPQADSYRAYLSDSLQHKVVRDLVSTAKILQTNHDHGRVMWREWGNGPPLVLFHGGFGSWLHWVRNIQHLSKDFRVIAADLPGLGQSDPVGNKAPSASDVARPLINGLEQLLGPDERLRMACFSLGAVIGSQVAHAMLPRLDRLVLIGPSGLGDHWRNITADLMRRHPSMTAEERRETIRHNLQHSMIAAPEAIDEMALDIQSDLLRQKRQLIGMPISLSTALLDVLPDLAPRLTIIWGDCDRYPVPDVPTVAAILRQGLPGIDISIVPKAGHWTAYEAASQINETLTAIFKSKRNN